MGQEIGELGGELARLDAGDDPALAERRREHPGEAALPRLLVAGEAGEEVAGRERGERRQVEAGEEGGEAGGGGAGAAAADGEAQREEDAVGDRLAMAQARVAGGRLDGVPEGVAEVERWRFA